MLTSTFNKMLIQYGYTKMKCGNISKQTKMKRLLEFFIAAIKAFPGVDWVAQNREYSVLKPDR